MIPKSRELSIIATLYCYNQELDGIFNALYENFSLAPTYHDLSCTAFELIRGISFEDIRRSRTLEEQLKDFLEMSVDHRRALSIRYPTMSVGPHRAELERLHCSLSLRLRNFSSEVSPVKRSLPR